MTDHHLATQSPFRPRHGLLHQAWPWLAFATLLLAGWRVGDLANALPAYDDVLEVVWAVRWYDGVLRGGHAPWVYPLAFYPNGWHVATYAGGPFLFLVLLPLHWLGGAAFAYNVATLLALLVSFGGMLTLGRRFLQPLAAGMAALLFTFWGFHWSRAFGHLNVMLALAALPWMAWVFDQGLRRAHGQMRWFVATGVLWAVMVTSSLYFVWMGALLVGAWLVGRLLARQVTVRQAFVAGATSAIVALVISAPWLFIFLRESAAANAPFYDITHVSKWDASLNSFPIPNIDHPWLQSLARLLYRGPVNEPGQANLGFVASLLAILGAAAAWRNRYWWPVMICAGVGLALALGLTLKWDGVSLQWSGFRPVNTLLWQLGYALKPGFFTTNTPPAPFDNAVPMPGLWLSAIVPLWERSRVFARYALLGGLGIYLLAGRGIMRIPRPWARAIVVVVLIFEVMPPATKNVPFPPPSHPAFEFVKAQKMDTAGTIDLSAWQPDLLYMPIGGATLWETEYHGKPTVAGASSVWPAHVVVLDQWLQEHPHAFLHPDFVPLLRQYGVNLVIFHVTGGYAADMLDEARQNLGLQELRCFDPADTSGPWPYVICILRVQDEE